MMVKICGVTNLDDALAAAEGGASAVGFNFYPPSPRFVDPGEAARIGAKLPPGVWKVGIFVNENGESIARDAGLDIVQIHGAAPEPGGVRLWRAHKVVAAFRLDDLDDSAEAFLLDTPSDTLWGGTGRTFDWSRAAGSPKKIILSGGLDASNVRRAIEVARPWGVDASSRLESAPGRKDHQKMLNFLKAALA